MRAKAWLRVELRLESPPHPHPHPAALGAWSAVDARLTGTQDSKHTTKIQHFLVFKSPYLPGS